MQYHSGVGGQYFKYRKYFCFDCSLGAESKFSHRLQLQHMQDAHRWVLRCSLLRQDPLDACGERGDLFFLLMYNPWLLALPRSFAESQFASL